MQKILLSCAAAAALMPGIGFAKEPAAAVLDAYYVVLADFEIEGDLGAGASFDSEFDDGDGFGVKGRFNLTPSFFIAGEYQANEYEDLEIEGATIDVDAELDTIRGGAGFRFAPNLPFYVMGEYIYSDLEIDGESEDDSGFGAHIGLDSPVADTISLYGQAGYVDIGGGDGFEVLGGVVFMFTPAIGAFADYRYTDLEDDDVESTFGDFRAGLRIALN